jgi:(E)-4-hydroxy-3-methylbut-2-enyl-diphosphate synthase
MSFNVMKIAEEIEARTAGIRDTLKIAIMGCVVNGPGEAREADLGIAGMGKGQARLYVKGIVKEIIPESEIIPVLLKEIDQLIKAERR